MDKVYSLQHKFSAYYILIFLLFIVNVNLSVEASETGDTIGTVKDARNVLVTKEKGKIKVYSEYTGADGKDTFFYYSAENEVKEDPSEFTPDHSGFDISLPFYNHEQERADSDYGEVIRKSIRNTLLVGDDIYWGWRFNYNDKRNVTNGFEAGIKNIIGIGWQRGVTGPMVSIGVGLGVKRFTTKDPFAFKVENDILSLEESKGNYSKISSSLNYYTIHLPIILRQNIGKICAINIGWIFDFNIYADARNSYKSSDYVTTKIKYTGIQQRFLTGELNVGFSIYGIGIYASWAPVSLFSTQYGPSIKGWSVGVNILTM